MNSTEDVLTRLWSQASEFPPNRQYHAYKYFSPRWRKTQLTLFASCVNTDRSNILSTEERLHDNNNNNNNTKLVPPKITTDDPTSTSQARPEDGGAQLSTTTLPSVESSSVRSINEVFLAPPSSAAAQQRRGSEPAKSVHGEGSALGRKLNRLNRSHSTGVVKEKVTHEHRKLSKSKSSDTERHTGEGGNNHAGNTATPTINFSPEFVRKTSLRTSLHDWLGSHKMHLHTKTSRKSKKSTGNGDCGPQLSTAGTSLAGQRNNNAREKTASDGDAADTIWKPECNQSDNSSSKHVYRRFSAETMNMDICKPVQKERCSRRPSAPPSLSEERSYEDKRSVKVRTMTAPQNMQHTALVSCCNTDTKYANLLDFHLHCLMKEELRSRLGGLSFRADTCRSWCEQISEHIKTRVQLLSSTPCKVICTVYIGALRDFGLHSATQALLDHKLDHHASASYQNKSLFAVASVFAIQFSCK